MADNKLQMPSSSAGITSYTDEYKSRFMFSPKGVLIIIAVVVTFVVLLHVLA